MVSHFSKEKLKTLALFVVLSLPLAYVLVDKTEAHPQWSERSKLVDEITRDPGSEGKLSEAEKFIDELKSRPR